jgi:16S rRNA (cytosine1402-N4)-methyltransferase
VTTDRPLHVPVLLERVVELLTPALAREGAVAIDATLGLGGHTEALLAAHPHLRVIGIDRDPAALTAARARLAAYGDRLVTAHATYDLIADVLDEQGIDSVDGVLMDLGVSSMQLDERERGFSYAADAPLDMRMDPTQGITAADILASYDERALTRILRAYGEEKFAQRIARNVVRRQATDPVTRSADLVDLVRNSIPQAARREGGNPAKRTFQALRIEVNGELAVLERALPAAVAALRVGGRMVVMAYQSLEDRLVKHEFARHTTITVPHDLPFVPDSAQPAFRLLTKGAEQADEAERERNPRSAPVRLRAVERVRAAA